MTTQGATDLLLTGCCACDTFDKHGNRKESVKHSQLFQCANAGCDHWTCGEHRVQGYCYGCAVEMGILGRTSP